MEQYNMRANFYPAKTPTNGFIGSADLAISDILRLRGIAVFENSDGPGHHIQFPSFGEGQNRVSYVVPHSKEAHGQILDVIEKAIADQEQHFGHVAGKRNPQLSVSGQPVFEPYADARFSLAVGDICTIYGITTREVPYERSDGKDGSFVAVNVPNLPPYEKDGETIYPPIFKGLKSSYEKDGQRHDVDYGQMIRYMVLSEREKALAKLPLENQMDAASQKAMPVGPVKDAPTHER